MKEIFIRRHEDKSTFLQAYPEIISSSNQRLGSVLDGRGPLRGLSFEQEKEYLSPIIGVSPDANEFGAETTAFWKNLSIPVPITGVKLNIDVDEDGRPENPEDWIKYQWALKHPEVESSKGAADANIKARFYIYDPEEETERQNKQAKVELAAATELTKVISGTKSDETIKRLVRILVSQNPDRLSRSQMENALHSAVKENPERFIEVVKDKHLELHDLVLQLTETNVVQRIGQQYRYNDDTIAATLDEMIAFLANKRNSTTLAEMKAKLQEAKKVVA